MSHNTVLANNVLIPGINDQLFLVNKDANSFPNFGNIAPLSVKLNTEAIMKTVSFKVEATDVIAFTNVHAVATIILEYDTTVFNHPCVIIVHDDSLPKFKTKKMH